MIVLTVVLAVLFVSLTVGVAWASTDLLIRRRVKQVVVVELQSGATFKGVLSACDAKTLVLRNVEALSSEQTAAMAVDGELLLPRGDIKYLQRP